MSTLDEQVKALGLPAMSDDELKVYLGIMGTKECDALFAKITPDERAVYDQMHAVEVMIPQWQAGFEPYPSDVSVNRGRGRKKRDGAPPATGMEE